jgi:hypothetical protein
MMAHVICNIEYPLSFMANHKSRLSAAIFRQEARSGPRPAARTYAKLLAATRTALFRVMANGTCNIRAATSHMHTQNRQDGHSKSQIPYQASFLRYPPCHISYHLWQMAHAASVILDATSALAYTVSKITKKTYEDTGSCPTSS